MPVSSKPRSLPVTIVAGYLGSGKTTLINRVLNNADGCKYAVLVNDFGELAIDAQLIESEDGNVVNLSGGCVCCSYGNDLTSAMMQLDANSFDQIVIEASGVALPGAIAGSLSLHAAFTVASILVLVDSASIQTLATDKYVADTIERQLQAADLILVNKTDLLTDEAQAKVDAWLREQYPSVPLLTTTHADKDVGDNTADLFLLDHSLNHIGKYQEDSDNETHSTSMYNTFTLDVAGQYDVPQLAARLASAESGLIRVKGFVSDLDGHMQVIQIVGKRWTVQKAPIGVQPGLVCIGLIAEGCCEETVLRSLNYSAV